MSYCLLLIAAGCGVVAVIVVGSMIESRRRRQRLVEGESAIDSRKLDQVVEFLMRRGPPRIVADLTARIKPSLRLRHHDDPTVQVPRFHSRLGGRPDLPTDIEWPSHEGRPLSFIAQVNLDQAGSLHPDNPLPPRGMLFFFYELTRHVWGFDPADRGNWRVIYTEEASPAPDGGLGQVVQPAFQAVSLIPDLEFVVPPLESQGLGHVALTSKESEQWFSSCEALEMLTGDHGPKHRLLGWPDPVQGEMELQCALTANGLYTGDSSGYEDPRRKEIEPTAAEWILLLQVDSDDEANVMWGDAGMLYFWIRKADLAARDFSKVWMILQCG